MKCSIKHKTLKENQNFFERSIGIEAFIRYIAASEIQNQWRKIKEYTKLHISSKVIQRTWRRKSFRKVYHFYRDLIISATFADPKAILRAIEPNETAIFDGSMKAHVRLRLGGETFPPLILYKIYTFQSICDLACFAPRNYASNVIQRNIQDISNETAHTGYIRVGKSNFAFRMRGNLDRNLPGWKNNENETNPWRILTSNKKENLYNVTGYKSHKKQRHKRVKIINDISRHHKKSLKPGFRFKAWSIKSKGSSTKTLESLLSRPLVNKPMNGDHLDETVNLVQWTDELDYDLYLR